MRHSFGLSLQSLFLRHKGFPLHPAAIQLFQHINKKRPENMQHISFQDLQAKLLTNEISLLIDVREPSEHEAFNIGGLLIPLDELIRRVSEIPKDEPVVFYCAKGIRSQIAIQRLIQKFDFTNLLNLAGGITPRKQIFTEKEKAKK